MARFDRFLICAAYYIVAQQYHSGQWSKGYRKLSQLSRMGFRLELSLDRWAQLKGTEERNAATELLWKRKREIVRT